MAFCEVSVTFSFIKSYNKNKCIKTMNSTSRNYVDFVLNGQKTSYGMPVLEPENEKKSNYNLFSLFLIFLYPFKLLLDLFVGMPKKKPNRMLGFFRICLYSYLLVNAYQWSIKIDDYVDMHYAGIKHFAADAIMVLSGLSLFCLWVQAIAIFLLGVYKDPDYDFSTSYEVPSRSSSYPNIDAALSFRESNLGNMSNRDKARELSKYGMLSGLDRNYGSHTEDGYKFLNSELGNYSNEDKLKYLKGEI